MTPTCAMGDAYLLQMGITSEGKIKGLDVALYNNAGNSLDLSSSIMDRALLLLDNGYAIPAIRAVGHCCFTNQASNTAFRGFGGPQACPVPVLKADIMPNQGICNDVSECLGSKSSCGPPSC